MRYDDGMITTSQGVTNLFALERVGELGVFAGSGVGGIFRWTSGEFVEVTMIGGTRVLSMAPLSANAVLVKVDKGGVSQIFFDRDNYVCPIQHLGGDEIVLRVEGGFVTYPHFGGDDKLTFFNLPL